MSETKKLMEQDGSNQSNETNELVATAVEEEFSVLGATNEDTVEVALLNIEVTTVPTKMNYMVGDKFDPTGMVVTATYSDGSTKIVTNYSYPTTSLTIATFSVVISYTENDVTKTVEQEIFVETAGVEGYFGNRNISRSNYGENPIWNLQTMGMRYLQSGLSIGMNSYAIGANLVYDSQMKDRLQDMCKGMPKGWKLDAHQFVVIDGKDDRGYFTCKYIDGEGYVHTFEKYSSYSSECYDTEGAGLVLTVGSTYAIRDKNNNQMLFNNNGKLIKTVSGRNTANIKHYQYDTDGRLSRIYDNRKTARYVSFEYNTDNLLTAIETYENEMLFETLKFSYTNGNISSIDKIKNGVSGKKMISAFEYATNGKLRLMVDKQTNNAALVIYQFDFIRNDYIINKISRGCMNYSNHFREKTFEKLIDKNTQNDFKTYCEITLQNEKGIKIARKIDSDGNMVAPLEKISSDVYKTLQKEVGVKLAYGEPSSSSVVFNSEKGLSLQSETTAEVALRLTNPYINLRKSRYYNLSFCLNYRSENFKKLYACITYTSNGTEYKVYKPIDVKLIHVWQKITLPIDLQNTNGEFSNVKLTFVTFNESNVAENKQVNGYVSCFRMNAGIRSDIKVLGSILDNIMGIMTSVKTVDMRTDNHTFTASDFMKTMESYYMKKLGKVDIWKIYYDNGRKCIIGSDYLIINYTDKSCRFAEDSEPEWYMESVNVSKIDTTITTMSTRVDYTYTVDNIVITTNTMTVTETKDDETGETETKTKEKTTVKTLDYFGRTINEMDENYVQVQYEYSDIGNLIKQTLVGADDVAIVLYEATEADENIVAERSLDAGEKYTYENLYGILDKVESVCYNGDIETLYNTTNYSYNGYYDEPLEISSVAGNKTYTNTLSYEQGKLSTVTDGKVKYGFTDDKAASKVKFGVYDSGTFTPLEEIETSLSQNTVTHTYYREKDTQTDTFICYYDEYGRLQSEKSGAEYVSESNYKVKYEYIEDPESKAAQPIEYIIDEYSGRKHYYEYDTDGRLVSETVYKEDVNDPEYTILYVNGGSTKMYEIGADLLTRTVVQDGKLEKIINSFNNAEIPVYDRYYTYDYHGRLSTKRALNFNGPSVYITESETKYTYGNNHMLPLSERYTNSGHNQYEASFTYDARGNVKTINIANTSIGDTEYEYEYDAWNRLTKETVQESNGETVRTYTYDETHGRLSSFNGTTMEYDNRGRLTRFGDTNLTYDNYGNRLTKGSTSYTWTRGRLLDGITGVANYTYDYKGLRTKKVVNGVTHEYIYDGDRLICEKRSNGDVFYFFHDESGICGVRYNGVNYEYRKNIFGDVASIYDQFGVLVGLYHYDAWGNNVDIIPGYNNENDFININPIRYRGYYYDTESGLYYLQSRYYDPSVGQFISPDTPDYLYPELISGIDLYSYCGNEPINRYDPTGHFWDTVFDILSIAWSAWDFFSDPSWANFGWLVLDGIFAVVPFLTGSRLIKAASKLDEVAYVGQSINRFDNFYDTVVLGNDMNRVMDAALNMGATFYGGYGPLNALSSLHKFDQATDAMKYAAKLDNVRFIIDKVNDGYKFVHIGSDGRGFFKMMKSAYGMELKVLYRLKIGNKVHRLWWVLNSLRRMIW